MSRNQGSFRKIGLAACVIAFCAGTFSCMTTPKKTAFMKQANIVDVSTSKLRVKVHGFATHFAAVVEETANQIEVTTPDKQTRIDALLWKMHAIPVGYVAAMQNDPLAALIDVWVLCRQMRVFFETGAGRERFGEQHPLVVQASRQLEAEAEALARSIARDPKMPEAHAAIAQWVEENPIESLLFGRDSPTSTLADLVAGEKRGAFAVVGSLGESVADLSSRFTIYAEVLPKMARWQAKLLIEQIVGEEELGEAVLALNSLTALEAQVADAMLLVDDLPGLVSTERELILSTLQAERAILTRFIEEQRLETFEFVQGERAAALHTLHDERVATMEELRLERAAIMADIRVISDEMIDEARLRGEELIDHLVWRLAQLFAALALVAGVFGLIAVLLLRRPRRAAS